MEIKTIDELNAIQFKQLVDVYYETASSDEAEVKYKYFDYYHENTPQMFLVGLLENKVVGYVCGLCNTLDHYEQLEMHSYLNYFQKELEQYPAHLHINVAANTQGQGVGKKLIENFELRLKNLGAAGTHIITLKGLANNDFYAKQGYSFEKEQNYHGKDLLFMGKKL